MNDDTSTGTRWQATVAAAIPGLPYPTRPRTQRLQWPAGVPDFAADHAAHVHDGLLPPDPARNHQEPRP